MITLEVSKELLARIKLPELEIEARATITPGGDVELRFMPWSQWNMNGDTFEQLVEDYNLLKAQIKLCVENNQREQLKVPPRRR